MSVKDRLKMFAPLRKEYVQILTIQTAMLPSGEALYRQRLSEIDAELVELETMIGKLTDPKHREVLRLRYIQGYEWELICYYMHYSWSQAHRLHDQAIAILDETE